MSYILAPNKEMRGNAYTIASVLLPSARVLLTRIPCLTRSLRWLTRVAFATPLQEAPFLTNMNTSLERGENIVHHNFSCHCVNLFRRHWKICTVVFGE